MNVEKVTEIPSDATVYHYDELDEQIKHLIPALIRGSSNAVDRSVADASIDSGDYVKFTEYYRIVC